ncbi:hypothetical protein P3T76_009603 [Phytophthora citrophthora]|uniref:RanBP2-type domain-containing protein n=1 Tax=Phytophthora citrophthora TaxID=4793 RepID=A0AAD9LIU3_9STRA|nr:hypothetical protein P3T76_009603 [Phytophthora citrophthora]
MDTSEDLRLPRPVRFYKHWFQTAGDLRSARRETTEWQALEVPGRLKLAIQQVLDQTVHHEVVPNYGYEEYYATVRPSLTPGSETTTQDWAETTTTETEQDYYSSGYIYSSSDTTSESAQYYDQTDYAPPSYDESLATNYQGNYYSHSNSDTSNSYDNGAAATALLSLQGSTQCQVEPDAVEAHTVEEDHAVEGELATDQTSYAVELGEPTQLDPNDTTGSWSCGQCTYMNPMTASFCEMCIGHISLSPDVKTTAGTSVSASLLIPAKAVVDIEMNSPKAVSFPDQSQLSSVTCLLPPVGSLYPPSAPDFDEPVDPSPLPPPPPYPGTSSCGNVDFLALAFSGNSAPKTQAPPSYIGKSSQMRREEAADFTEYTF